MAAFSTVPIVSVLPIRQERRPTKQGGCACARMFRSRFAALTAVSALVISVSGGCTSLHDYVHNGFKVGPNYCQPDAARGRPLDRCRRHPADRRHREPSAVVDGLQRPQAELSGLLRVSPKSHAAGSGFPSASGAGPACDCPGQTSFRRVKGAFGRVTIGPRSP